MCYDARVPVCWRSRISSERIPVSSECPQLKERQRGHSDVERGRVCSLFADVHSACLSQQKSSYRPETHYWYIHKVHNLLATTEGKCTDTISPQHTAAGQNGQNNHTNWGMGSLSCLPVVSPIGTSQRYTELLSLAYGSPSRSLNKQMSRNPRLEKSCHWP